MDLLHKMGELHQVNYNFSKLVFLVLFESAASDVQEVGWCCPLTLNMNTSLVVRFLKDPCRAVSEM